MQFYFWDSRELGSLWTIKSNPTIYHQVAPQSSQILFTECLAELSPQVETGFSEYFICNNETCVANFLKNSFTFVIFGKDVHNE